MRVVQMTGRQFCILAMVASVFRGSNCGPLSMSSTSAYFPYCSPGSSECIKKSTAAGDVWVPPVRQAARELETQLPFTAAGFDSTTPCPTRSLYNSGIDSQLIGNQVRTPSVAVDEVSQLSQEMKEYSMGSLKAIVCIDLIVVVFHQVRLELA